MSETSGKALQLTSRLPNRLSSDEELARRVSGGDSSAFEEVFRRYNQPIYGFCSAMVGVEEAKDVLQNVMTKAMTSMPSDKDFQMKSWLYRVARNECVDQIRSASRSPHGFEADTVADRSGFHEPHRTAENREQLRQLVEDLNELPDNQRAVLVMRELSGLGYGEIAGIVGTSEAGAKQTVYEARLALEQMDLGRSLACAEVRQTISTLDRRRLRGRTVRSHLRTCAVCRDFERSIRSRETSFRSLYPALPLGVGAGLLDAIREGGSAAGLAGSGAAGAATGSVVTGGLVSKGVLTLVVAGGIGVGTAEVVKHRDPAGSGADPVSRAARSDSAVAPGVSTDTGGNEVFRISRGVDPGTGKSGQMDRRRPDTSESKKAVPGSPRDAAPDAIPGAPVYPVEDGGEAAPELPTASAAGQEKADEASSAKPGITGNPPPSRKPPIPPGQASDPGSSTSGPPAAGQQGNGQGQGAAKAVGRPESPGKSGK